ncbi:hypothetical protein Cgig2_027032 [Carnegiea gigantea]|uniref:BAR domain-containing protein n=1 Tax=Carnegiea gigantea TaxID=171969 RepID=A0A9Q1K860_9CARY|nr:hypothetical protein Cgig2_027032 [Carnegiea gigantea]
MNKSLKKLLRRHKHDRKEPRIQPLAHLDDLAQASQDMQDMKDCYDGLLSAAAVTTNSAYEFSESLREMGVCLLQKIELSDDEETGEVMMMLGKVQFELQKLVDSYRAHICQTITVPSESLINEIQTLEEMKHQCDENREFYEYMCTRYREKGRPKSGKEERFSSEQLQLAKDEFDEEATLFVFRLKSLKQGLSRSLLTQTARHHAAQLAFFRKALKALEVVEPHVKLVAEQQHIDYQFSGLDDESEDDNNDDDDGEESHRVSSASSISSMGDDGELSFDYRHSNQQRNPASAIGNATELDLDNTLPSVSRRYFTKCILELLSMLHVLLLGELILELFRMTSIAHLQENLKVYHEESFMQERRMLSQSAPLFPQQKVDEQKVDAADSMRPLRPSTVRKFRSYALPKPGDSKISISTGRETPVSQNKPRPQFAQNLYHSCPLQPKKFEELDGTENLVGRIIPNHNAILKESNNNRMPPPLIERISLPRLNPDDTSRIKKPKLQFFSGPITSKPLSTEPSFSAKNHVLFKEWPQFSSGPILRGSPHQSSYSSKGSPTASPAITSSPRISELHKLPRPPTHAIYNSGRPSGFSGFSAPLVSRSLDHSTTNKMSVKMAPPLPTPPLIATVDDLKQSKDSSKINPSRPSETSNSSEKSETAASLPLTPIL